MIMVNNVVYKNEVTCIRSPTKVPHCTLQASVLATDFMLTNFMHMLSSYNSEGSVLHVNSAWPVLSVE